MRMQSLKLLDKNDSWYEFQSFFVGWVSWIATVVVDIDNMMKLALKWKTGRRNAYELKGIARNTAQLERLVVNIELR